MGLPGAPHRAQPVATACTRLALLRARLPYLSLVSPPSAPSAPLHAAPPGDPALPKYIATESGGTHPLQLPDPITAYLTMTDLEPGTLILP